ncbi:MAG TPA: SRPBCC family protein [Nocardioides sp.]|nr:SRPBCC family protein [Nocardioides sp.]
MADNYETLIEDSIEIDASPEEVWELVTDVPRMAQWSPQVVRSKVKGEVGLGATFSNLNRQGFKRWPTNGRIVRFSPPTGAKAGEFAFKIRENKSVWAFDLEPIPGGGTKVTERRETPEGISGLSLILTKAALGGQRRFTDELRRGIRTTLERIKAEAEA